MNEASKKRRNPWGKTLKITLIGYVVVSSIAFTAFYSIKESDYNELVDLTEKTNKALSETQQQVEEQTTLINNLQLQNDKTKATLDETTGLLEQSKNQLEQSKIQLETTQKQVDTEKARANKAEADLKKKRASRAQSSAVPVTKVSASAKTTGTSVAGMTAFQATAYYYGTTTASGTRVKQGRTIAVDPRLIPLGTKVRVSSPTHPHLNGVYIAEDTGGVIKGRIIDIYMNSRNDALSFGRRTVYVEVLN